MDKLHPHAAAIDRIGSDVVRNHFDITRQTLYNWRTKGVSATYRKALILLGEVRLVDMSELKASVDA